MFYITEERLRGLRILAGLLRIHSYNYPKFADTSTWLESHLLLGKWLIPEELRNKQDPKYPIDLFYVAYLANYLNLSYEEVLDSFMKAYSNAPQSQES